MDPSTTPSIGDVFADAPTAEERRTQLAYAALMQALARPGEVWRLPAPGLAVAGECLLDLEVSFFAPDPDLAWSLTLTGARPATADQADFLFLPRVDDAAMAELVTARVGDPLYPDRSATLFLGARIGSGGQVHLSGPGIPGRRTLQIDGLPASFWPERNRACRYPLGWDVFLVDGDQVIGLPRSTQVEAEPWPM